MKLDRNLNPGGRGKYGLILNRELANLSQDASAPVAAAIRNAIATLETHGILDWGDTVSSEFFVIRLKDENAAAALHVYGASATLRGDPEYGREIEEMSRRAGPNHPNCKKPD